MSESFKAGLSLSLVELVGDVSLKKFAETGVKENLVVGYGSYVGLATILAHALKTEKLGIVNSQWDGISNLLTTGASIALGEEFTSKQIMGMLLISAGLFML